MSYYNTTHALGADLRRHTGKAETQEKRILDYLLSKAPQAFSPSQLHLIIFLESVPLTSVRRALSDLTNELKIEKTAEQKTGKYGRPEYCWRAPVHQLRLI